MSRQVVRAWELQQQWSHAATRAHQRIDRLRSTNLVLLVAAALVGAAAAMAHDQPGVVRVLGVVAAILLGVAGVVQQRFLTAGQVEDWADTRLAAEQLKSAVWRALGVRESSDDVADAMRAAIDRGERTVASRGEPVAEKELTPLPDVSSVEEYAEKRAARQAAWHEQQASTLRQRSRWLRMTELALTLLGVAVSAIAAASTEWNLAPVVAAITTIAAAIAAHLSASKYQRVAAGYRSTASRLRTLSVDVPTDDDRDAVPQFVEDVERVLAEQNTAWTALVSAE